MSGCRLSARAIGAVPLDVRKGKPFRKLENDLRLHRRRFYDGRRTADRLFCLFHCVTIFSVMGQIIIEIPDNKNRRYILSDTKRAGELLSDLDATAKRVKNNGKKLTRQQLEDLEDYLDAKKAMDEMRSTGISYTVDDLRGKYGLV